MKVEIFGSDWCVPCRNAKKLCEEKQLEYTFNDISSNGEALEEIKRRLGKSPATIPQIFIDGNHIGGFNEFQQTLGV